MRQSYSFICLKLSTDVLIFFESSLFTGPYFNPGPIETPLMTTHYQNPVAEICQFEMSLRGLEPRSYLQRNLHTTYNPDIHRRVQTCRQDVCVVCTALTQSIVVDLVFVYCSNCHHFYISRYLDPDALTCGDSS